MSVLVRIPTPLRSLTQGQAEVKVEGGSIGELIERLDAKYVGLKDRLCEGDGKIRRFINIYVNEEDIRFLQGPATPLKTGDAVSIVPAIAGGAQCTNTNERITVTKSGSCRRRPPGSKKGTGYFLRAGSCERGGDVSAKK